MESKTQQIARWSMTVISINRPKRILSRNQREGRYLDRLERWMGMLPGKALKKAPKSLYKRLYGKLRGKGASRE